MVLYLPHERFHVLGIHIFNKFIVHKRIANNKTPVLGFSSYNQMRLHFASQHMQTIKTPIPIVSLTSLLSTSPSKLLAWVMSYKNVLYTNVKFLLHYLKQFFF